MEVGANLDWVVRESLTKEKGELRPKRQQGVCPTKL